MTQSRETAEEFIARQRERWKKNPWIRAKDIQRNGFHWWRREAFTFHVQANYPEKVLVMERLTWDRFETSADGALPYRTNMAGEVQYRIGYYIVSRTGKWWWGQFAPFLPADDFHALIDRARDEGTLRPA